MLRIFSAAAIVSLALAVAASAQYVETYGQHAGYHQGYDVHKVIIAETLVVPVALPVNAFISVNAPTHPPAVTISQTAYERSVRSLDADKQLAKRLDDLDAKLSRLITAPAKSVESARSGPPKLRFAAKAETAKVSLATVAGIFSEHCATCHTGSKAEEGVQIFNDAGEYEPTVSVARMIGKVLTDKMPKGPNKVPETQKQLLRQFLKGTE